MTDYELIRKALSIAKEAHAGQVDKAGAEYISSNHCPIAVKKADLTMNMDLSRIEDTTEKEYLRIEEKYKPALEIIER